MTPRMPFSDPKEDLELYKFTRDRLRAEATFRRERQWAVFSWISSLFLAVIGGAIAIASNSLNFSLGHKVLLTGAVIVFFMLGVLRIQHDGSVAKFYSKACWDLDAKFGVLYDDRSFKGMHLANIGFLLFMAATTIGVIWVTPTDANGGKNASSVNSPASGISVGKAPKG
jgi:hypothetical protein